MNVRISQTLSTPRKSTHTYLLRNHRGGKLSIILIRNDGGSRVVHLEWMPRYDRQDVAPVRDRRPRAHDTIRRSNRKPSKNPGCYGQEHQHHIRIHAAAKRLCFDWMLTEHSKPCIGLHFSPPRAHTWERGYRHANTQNEAAPATCVQAARGDHKTARD